MKPDVIVFALSQYNLSAGRFRRMAAALEKDASLPVRLVRMEDGTASLPSVLDEMAGAGHRTILVQPLGLPFPETLSAWLPGAIGNWLAGRDADAFDIRIGPELCDVSDLLPRAVAASLEAAASARPVDTGNTALGKPGWENPPDFTHHLLVCTGPRCQYRDAASLLLDLKDAVARAGLTRQCLTTRTGCMFPCNKGPMVAVYPRGEWYRLETRDAVERFVTGVLGAGRTQPDLLIHTARTARETLVHKEPIEC